MSLQHIPFELITEESINRLIADRISEGKTLEYKESVTFVTEEQKRELLSDVTALANTDGGDIIYGLRADRGVATELIGLNNFIPDDSIARIENLFRDSIQPRLSGYQIRALRLANTRYVLLIRPPRSFAAPHMVRHGGVTRFCGRNANGKYDLDVQQLRSAFLANEALADRLKNFRLDRINRLLAGQAPTTCNSHYLMVLHVLPVVSARPDTRFTTSELEKALTIPGINPIGGGGYSPLFNFDGPLIASHWGPDEFHSSIQIFRNGFLEGVECQTLNPSRRENGQKLIPSISWEEYIVNALPGCFRALEFLGLMPPYVISISLLNVRGFEMYVGPRFVRNARPIDRDHLLTEEILVENKDTPAGKILRPLFNQVWNACGWPYSINYNEKGEWYKRG